eukprot:scaffold9999_cov146-Isochrysis_galbana.AAC.2
MAHSGRTSSPCAVGRAPRHSQGSRRPAARRQLALGLLWPATPGSVAGMVSCGPDGRDGPTASVRRLRCAGPPGDLSEDITYWSSLEGRAARAVSHLQAAAEKAKLPV